MAVAWLMERLAGYQGRKWAPVGAEVLEMVEAVFESRAIFSSLCPNQAKDILRLPLSLQEHSFHSERARGDDRQQMVL